MSAEGVTPRNPLGVPDVSGPLAHMSQPDKKCARNLCGFGFLQYQPAEHGAREGVHKMEFTIKITSEMLVTVIVTVLLALVLHAYGNRKGR